MSEMSGACSSTIILHAGMNGFVVCKNSRFSAQKALLIKMGKWQPSGMVVPTASKIAALGTESDQSVEHSVQPKETN